MEYKVYEFHPSGETCVLPTCWIRNGEVRYVSKKAPDYAKKGKLPYKKWPKYKVNPICEKTFASYDVAYKAEALLLEKSDLDTTDIDSIVNPKIVLNKKRRRRPPTKPADTSDDSHDDVEDEQPKLPSLIESSIAEGEGDKLPEILVENFTESQPRMNSSLYETSNDFNENTQEQVVTEPPAAVEIMPITYTLATEVHINELKTLILDQKTLIEYQNSKIDNLTTLVMNMKKRSRLDVAEGNLVFHLENISLPLKSVDSIEILENSLNNENTAADFKSFLQQLGGNCVKACVKLIVRELYTLDLQCLVNYSGREGKYRMCDLKQTKIAIEVMQINTGKTQSDAVDEYMYHLQHVADRIRSAKNIAARTARRAT